MVLVSQGASIFIDKTKAPTLGVRALFEREFGPEATSDSIPEGWVCNFDRQQLVHALVPADPSHLYYVELALTGLIEVDNNVSASSNTHAYTAIIDFDRVCTRCRSAQRSTRIARRASLSHLSWRSRRSNASLHCQRWHLGINERIARGDRGQRRTSTQTCLFER